MRTLKGTITCVGDPSIEEGSIINVEVIDCCLMDVPSQILGSNNIQNVKSFPFDYEVEYDDSKVNTNIYYGYRVQCRIEKDGKLKYINDTGFSILDPVTLGEILDRKDFHLIVL